MGCKVLINASNLHKGGGVQVATSFISELLNAKPVDFEFEIWVSSEIAKSLKSIDFDLTGLTYVKVVDVYGLSAFFSKYNNDIKCFDLVFTIFGPNYFRANNYISVVGFAQLWIIDNSAYQVLSIFKKIKLKAKFFVQGLFFKRSDAFVVELEHVKEGLCRKGLAQLDTVYVAHNCISSLYLKPEVWQPLKTNVVSPNIKIGFLGRDYVHKNTEILPDVKRIILEKYNLNVDFFVTLDDQEWAVKSKSFRSNIVNVGSLSVAQCPNFYQALDGVVFPSLLECFSATPLEAMAMEQPLFASNRRFVKDICGDFALYFDPLDPENAADVIADYFCRRYRDESLRLAAAREHAVTFSNAKMRAQRYVDIIRAELTKRYR